MTTTEYAAYEKRIADFMQREGLNNLYPHTSDDIEPYFSWRSCACCGTTLGGMRYDCNGYNPTTREVQGDYSVCVDCVYYAEYGQLNDLTMLDMVEG